jgi:hypothetical protein
MAILKCSGFRKPRAVFFTHWNDGVDGLEPGVRDAVTEVGQEIRQVPRDELGDGRQRAKLDVAHRSAPPRQVGAEHSVRLS